MRFDGFDDVDFLSSSDSGVRVVVCFAPPPFPPLTGGRHYVVRVASLAGHSRLVGSWCEGLGHY